MKFASDSVNIVIFLLGGFVLVLFPRQMARLYERLMAPPMQPVTIRVTGVLLIVMALALMYVTLHYEHRAF
jgi:protein-S-isoprenylcysteine O-methyltransferase Ste14